MEPLTSIPGVLSTPLRMISDERGSVLHCMKREDPGYCGFGEAYFSTITMGVIKGWKQHLHMTLNLTVPIGRIRFTAFDESRGIVGTDVISRDLYVRLTIPPLLWIAFEGLDDLNLLLNVADLPHDPKEIVTRELDDPRMPSLVYKSTS